MLWGHSAGQGQGRIRSLDCRCKPGDSHSAGWEPGELPGRTPEGCFLLKSRSALLSHEVQVAALLACAFNTSLTLAKRRTKAN